MSHCFRGKKSKNEGAKSKESSRQQFGRSKYLSILERFCVRAGTPVEMEKCTSSKTERDTKIAELMTTAPPTKPNTNSSMHPGLMALRWHGETPEPGRLQRGRGCIFVVKVCHSAAATKTMPSAAAFHSLLQRLQSNDITSLLPHQSCCSSQHLCSSRQTQPAS